MAEKLSKQQQLETAVDLAKRFHQGQKDKCGNDYILHPMRVMDRMDTLTKKTVAVLHDTIEDTPCTSKTLLKAGIDPKVVDAVLVLTRDRAVPYLQYIQAVKAHALAREVKLADIHDNLRDGCPVILRERYLKALQILESPTESALKVEGTKLVNENGNPVQLKGLSTHGIAWFPQYVNETTIKELKDMFQINVIRLAMYTAEYNGYCTGGNQEQLKQLIKTGVDAAIDNDLYVIVDWHILSDNDPTTNKEAAKDFFSEMTSLYKDCPNVLYEICNEPNGDTSWQQIKQYAEEVIPVIRENAPEAVVLVGTPQWSQRVDQAAADPIIDQGNVMYTLHFYAATHKDDLRNNMVNAIQSGLPIFVSEYGICDASGNGGLDIASADEWMRVLNEYSISSCIWNISNKDESSAIFQASCDKTEGFAREDLSDSGLWFLDLKK